MGLSAEIIRGPWNFIYLREFEVRELEFLHDIVPEDISSGEEPASTTTLLVRNRSSLEVNNIVEDVLVCNLCSA